MFEPSQARLWTLADMHIPKDIGQQLLLMIEQGTRPLPNGGLISTPIGQQWSMDLAGAISGEGKGKE